MYTENVAEQTILRLCVIDFDRITLKPVFDQVKMKIEIHPLTNNPTAAWKSLSKSQKVVKIHVSLPKQVVASNKVSIP